MAVAVDFDGVIHTYSKGWSDGSIYDPPMEGALESLDWLMQRVPVFVFTSRNAPQVADWLRRHGIPATADCPQELSEHNIDYNGAFWNRQDLVLVTNRKLAATHYIDDRALRFVNWSDTLKQLEDEWTTR